MFGMFYFVMEAFQTVQWLFGDVRENTLQGVNQYSIINRHFTIFAHLLIWSQPLLFSYIGYRTAANKKFFFCMIFINYAVLIISLVNLYGGFYRDDYYQINDSVFGLTTCTNVGDTGHLVWKFKPKSIDYFPNYLMYLVLCLLSFFMYDRSETLIIFYGWSTSLIITKLVLQPVLLELASSWCLLSVIANIMIFIYIKI